MSLLTDILNDARSEVDDLDADVEATVDAAFEALEFVVQLAEGTRSLTVTEGVLASGLAAELEDRLEKVELAALVGRLMIENENFRAGLTLAIGVLSPFLCRDSERTSTALKRYAHGAGEWALNMEAIADRLKPKALLEAKREQAAKDANDAASVAAADKHRRWQAEAEKLWLKNPKLSVRGAAIKLHVAGHGKMSTIRRVIEKAKNMGEP